MRIKEYMKKYGIKNSTTVYRMIPKKWVKVKKVGKYLEFEDAPPINPEQLGYTSMREMLEKYNTTYSKFYFVLYYDLKIKGTRFGRSKYFSREEMKRIDEWFKNNSENNK